MNTNAEAITPAAIIEQAINTIDRQFKHMAIKDIESAMESLHDLLSSASEQRAMRIRQSI